MNTEEYYTTPPQEIFDDVKETAKKIWSEYDDTYGYATEKLKRVDVVVNYKDNCAFIVALFDQENQQKLLERVQREDTREWLRQLYIFAQG